MTERMLKPISDTIELHKLKFITQYPNTTLKTTTNKEQAKIDKSNNFS